MVNSLIKMTPIWNTNVNAPNTMQYSITSKCPMTCARRLDRLAKNPCNYGYNAWFQAHWLLCPCHHLSPLAFHWQKGHALPSALTYSESGLHTSLVVVLRLVDCSGWTKERYVFSLGDVVQYRTYLGGPWRLCDPGQCLPLHQIDCTWTAEPSIGRPCCPGRRYPRLSGCESRTSQRVILWGGKTRRKPSMQWPTLRLP